MCAERNGLSEILARLSTLAGKLYLFETQKKNNYENLRKL